MLTALGVTSVTGQIVRKHAEEAHKREHESKPRNRVVMVPHVLVKQPKHKVATKMLVQVGEIIILDICISIIIIFYYIIINGNNT